MADLRPIYKAAKNGNVGRVLQLTTEGSNVNQTNENNRTALFFAAREGHLEIVNALLAAGADVNKPNNINATPLFISAQYGHLEVVKALLAAGADIDKPNKDNVTPLFVAAQEGQLEVVKVLLASGADINKSNNNNATPLFMAAQQGHPEVVKALLAAGADSNKSNNNNASPLLIAAYKGHLEVVKALLAAGADSNKSNKNNATPLFMAAQEGHLEIVKALLAAGAEINKSTEKKSTPLYRAAYNGHLEIVKVLLAAGADISKPTFLDKSTKQYAFEGAFSPAINELILSYVPKWGGLTQSDLEKYDTIFLKEAEPGKRAPAEDNSLCPVCLKQVIRESGCLYMSHDCSKEIGFYHKKLYDMYKNPAGIIVWCTSCGRICDNHRHYDLGMASSPKPPYAARAAHFDPFESDCRKTNGGGGLPEKLTRYHRLREVSLKLQEEVGIIDYTTACTELVEEAWNAPLIASMSAMTKRRLATIEKTSKWNIPINAFPKNSKLSLNIPKQNYISAGKFQPPKIHMPTDPDYSGNNIMMNYESPVIQFIHKPYKGGDFEDHIHIKGGGAAASTTKFFISIDGLTQYLKGVHGGKCFDPDCKANLYPEEIDLAFKDLKSRMGEDYVSKEAESLLSGYTIYFKEKMISQNGGRHKTRKQKGGSESQTLPFFQKAELAQCLAQAKFSKKQRKTRKKMRKN